MFEKALVGCALLKVGPSKPEELELIIQVSSGIIQI
jgi:hypothetical protein